MQGLMVTKRNGQQEKIDLDKIHRVIDWAADGLEDVSVSQVELKAQIQFFDGIRTSDIHETIIKSAADLISEETPDYQYMAARLAIFHLRKRAFGCFEPPHLGAHVKEMVALKRYDSDLLKDYTAAEFDQLDACLDPRRKSGRWPTTPTLLADTFWPRRHMAGPGKNLVQVYRT